MYLTPPTMAVRLLDTNRNPTRRLASGADAARLTGTDRKRIGGLAAEADIIRVVRAVNKTDPIPSDSRNRLLFIFEPPFSSVIWLAVKDHRYGDIDSVIALVLKQGECGAGRRRVPRMGFFRPSRV